MSKSPSNITESDLPLSFGRYELLEIVGQGGMGRVFRARLNGPAGFQKEVAVKVIIGGAETIPVHKRNQLAHEARLGGLLRHPNIVDTYELGDNDGGMFIAMEFVDGISLSKLISREKGLSVACALDILLQVTAALDHAHNLNINGSITPMIHRDLKPGNLLIDRAGMVKVTDFGLSMLHMQGAVHFVPKFVQGTLRYMSPEQVTGAELGVQSDLFSLGIIAYEMLMGRRLFPKGHPHETADRILLEEIKFKQSGRFQRVEALQPGLGDLILSCLRRHPGERINSAAVLFEQLRSLRIQAPGESLPQVLPRHIAGARMLHMPFVALGGDSQTHPWSRPHETGVDTQSITALRNTNIPTDRTPLYGRADLLKQIARQFKKKAQILTLKGPGGIGKTSVAIRYIQDCLDAFQGGTWVFDLTPARDLRGIVQIIAKDLDLPLGQGDLATCIEQIGRCIAARGHSLILLDNVEQVAEHMAATLGNWAENAPQARFVTTSRERLHLKGERILEVEPLDANESLALFRVRATKSDASGPPPKALSKQIIPYLEGNPLAIELAAARTREMGAEVLLEGLSERFLLIASQDRRPNRQATLRATIDWSWNLLTPWEQSALAQLSIFRGGFTMEAAEEILDLDHHANAPWLIDILQSLLDSSLLRAKTKEDQPRFVLYESIRQYAGEKLDVDRTELEVRLLSHFAAYGTPKHQMILRRGGPPARRMLAEVENLVHAFDLAILNQHPLALPCFMAVYDAFKRLGPISRIQSLSQQVLKLNLSPEETAAVSLKSCFAHIVGGQLKQAKTLIETARHTADQWQNHTLHAEALFLQATVQLQEGEINNAILSGSEAIAMAKQANEPRLEALAQGIVGRAHRMAGDYPKAETAYKTATELSRRMGDQSLLASNLGDEGTIAMMLGRLTDAAKRFGQSLAVAANTGDRRIQAARTFQLGTALLEAGELDSALKDYGTARTMFKEFGERFNEAMVLVGISQVHYIQENYPQARALLFECLELLKEVGSEGRAGIALANLGEIEIAMGDYVYAETHLNEAIRVSETFGMGRISAAAHSTLGLLYLRQGQHSKSEEALQIAEASLRGINEPTELGKMLCNQAELHLALGQKELALAVHTEATNINISLQTTTESELSRRIAVLNQLLQVNP